MTKQEVIQEAYGDLYNHLEIYMNDNGQFALSNLESYVFDLIEDSIKNSEIISLKNGLCTLKSLKGIENNNGWKTLENGIPTEEGFYIVGCFLGNNFKEKTTACDDLVQVKNCLNNLGYTHYFLIKPLKPIY